MRVSLRFIDDLAVGTALALEAHGLSRSDHAIWLTAGLTPTLLYARLGRAPVAWFYAVKPFPLRLRAGARYLAILGRLLGSPLPTPRFLDLRDPGGMAGWLAGRLRTGTPICVTTYASSAVRICAAASQRGIPLEGVCFITLGEPFTEAKQRIIERAGARALVRYAFTEAGIIGYGCGHPRGPDDTHLFSDGYGLVRRTRTVGDAGPSIPAFLFTSLLGAAPKILLNVESGDYGDVDHHACECALGAAGLTTHVSRIRSFEKLSSEGMTFVQTDLVRVLEEGLPARFGGTGADYQLVEAEGADGILRLRLIASPGLGQLDEAQVRETLLEELGKDDSFGRLGADTWRRAETVEVSRRWPVATGAGKVLPFHLLKAQDGEAAGSWTSSGRASTTPPERARTP